MQDTFLIALRRIDQLRDPEAVGGWLRTTLRNTCITQLREGRGEVPFSEPPRRLGNEPHEPSESSAEEAIDRLAMREWVWAALSELPESLRVTAMLRYFGSYTSYEEISAILGVPVGTVSSRLTQVKIKLADALLKTAELEHVEARRLTESQTRYWSAAWGELNRGQGNELFASAFSRDPAFVLSDGTVHGRGWMVEEFEGDLEVGMKLRLTNIVASKDVTVIEGNYENPPDEPLRCPSAISMVGLYHEGRIDWMRLHFASRPEDEEARQKP